MTTIVVTGGGSGGHITPLLAVAHELKKKQTKHPIKLVYIGQKGDQFIDVLTHDENIDAVYVVRAGKFRRYHGEGLKQLADLKTVVKNIRDLGWVVVGLWQSFWLLRRLKPDAIFIKGGFVGVPVGLAAALLRIPYITHDSDALPGLANRIVARWAKLHTVALPKEVYAYPPEKTVTVGIPLARHYKVVTNSDIQEARERLRISSYHKVLMITGGGLGAQRLNKAIADCVVELLDHYRDLMVLQLTGVANEAQVRQQYAKELSPKQQARVKVIGYVTNAYLYSTAADVIVTRAGATSMAEFAAQHKACIVVPNPYLTGGHQLQNAKVLTEENAVRLVSEEKLKQDNRALMPAIVDLFDHPDRIHDLGERLGKLARNDASDRLAMLLLEAATR